jgi:methanogenic corrinoid protein MtbC1
MVTDFFELDGWNTTFLGANTPAEAIATTVKDHQYDLIAISTTMTSHVEKVRKTIDSIRVCTQSTTTQILVGGTPFNLYPGLWKEVGADAYAGNAQEAVAVANLICTTSVTA